MNPVYNLRHKDKAKTRHKTYPYYGKKDTPAPRPHLPTTTEQRASPASAHPRTSLCPTDLQGTPVPPWQQRKARPAAEVRPLGNTPLPPNPPPPAGQMGAERPFLLTPRSPPPHQARSLPADVACHKHRPNASRAAKCQNDTKNPPKQPTEAHIPSETPVKQAQAHNKKIANKEQKLQSQTFCSIFSVNKCKERHFLFSPICTSPKEFSYLRHERNIRFFHS